MERNKTDDISFFISYLSQKKREIFAGRKIETYVGV
jgi:hypothetical protein